MLLDKHIIYWFSSMKQTYDVFIKCTNKKKSYFSWRVKKKMWSIDVTAKYILPVCI